MDVDFFLSKFMLLVSCDTHSECEINFLRKNGMKHIQGHYGKLANSTNLLA